MKGKGKPLGKSQRGKQRKFTNVEELKSQAEKISKRKELGLDGDEDDEEKSEVSDEEIEDSSVEESESEDEDHKPKGVESLIDIENPNRRIAKAAPDSANAQKSELSRKEKEELERQRRAAAPISLKSEKARADMARLALIRAERAQAALKREATKQQTSVVKKP